MADHSQKWHDGTTSKNIVSRISNDGLADLVNKLDKTGTRHEEAKGKCSCNPGWMPNLLKTSPRLRIALIRGKKIKEVRHGEYGQTTPFNGNNEGKFRVGPPGYYTKTDNRPPYGERRQSLEELLAKHQEESARRSTEMECSINVNARNNASSVPNDALMMIINDMHEQATQYVFANEQNKVVNEPLTVELVRYKKQVEIYEKRARFELTEREQKIDKQLRIIITDRNYKEESLKKEFHSLKMQLNCTNNNNKSMVEEVTSLKKAFKQKENKYLKDFLDMKALKEKVEDKLFKQDQSFQTIHMLCKPKPYYDEKKKVAIGYKNPLYLTSVIQVQSALYNGYKIVKTNYAPAVVHDSEDTLKLAELNKKRMLEKMKIPLCVEKKVKIAPLNYSKENYLATFTPQRHLTP
ncbi:hypothetical protein Tco_0621603 [Tanacetum coccineum]